MAFRLLNQKPQYRDNDGAICVNGYLQFFETGTSTPKDVYDDPALGGGNNIGNEVALDAAGRTEDDVWLDGVYRVVLYTADDEEVWTLDDVRDLDATVTVAVPDPADADPGQALFSDGEELYYDDISQVPDMTGQSGKVLGNDGADALWQTLPTLPSGGITQSSGKVTIGSIMILYGTGTATAASAQTVSSTVTFGTAFDSTPVVVVTPQVGAVTGESGGVEAHAASTTASGFTATFIAPDMGDVAGSENITSNVPYGWIAIGVKA